MASINLQSPEIYGLLIDSLSKIPSSKELLEYDRKLVLFGFRSVGKSIDENLRQKPSLKILETTVIPDYIVELLKTGDECTLIHIKLSLELYKYFNLPLELKNVL